MSVYIYALYQILCFRILWLREKHERYITSAINAKFDIFYYNYHQLNARIIPNNFNNAK